MAVVALSQPGKVLAVDTANDRILVLRRGASSKVAGKKPRAAVAVQPVRADILVRIEGMSCPFCAYGIEKHLKALKGVSEARVNLGESTAALTLQPGRKVSSEEIREAVEKAGFKANEIKAIASAGR